MFTCSLASGVILALVLLVGRPVSNDLAMFVAAGVVDVQARCELWEDADQLVKGELGVVWVEVDVLGPDVEDVLVVGAVAALDVRP